jgi:hypothetical protein
MLRFVCFVCFVLFGALTSSISHFIDRFAFVLFVCYEILVVVVAGSSFLLWTFLIAVRRYQTTVCFCFVLFCFVLLFIYVIYGIPTVPMSSSLSSSSTASVGV